MAAELEVGIGVDLKDLNEGLKRATDKFQEFGTKMGSIGSMMSLAITAPLVLVGKQMIKLASDSQEATNKVEVAFGKSSDAVKEFASTSLTQFGIAKGSAMDMASTYGDMSTSMGLTQQQAAQLSISLVGLAADLASFKNIGIDQANTALKGIFTGETESLKTLGIVMTEANLKAYALSKGFKGNTEDLTQGEKVLLRYNYVLENTKNSQGDFARTGGGAANQMRIFGESLKEIGDTFGSTILPYFTKAITYVNNLMKEFAKLDGETKKNILIGAVFVAAIGPTLVAISGIITAVKTIGLAFAGINAPIIGAIAVVAAFAYGASENFSTLKTNLSILSREFYNFEVTLVRSLRLINGNEWTNNRLMQLQDELVKRSDKINNIGFGKGIESFVAGIKKANASLSGIGLLDFTGKTIDEGGEDEGKVIKNAGYKRLEAFKQMHKEEVSLRDKQFFERLEKEKDYALEMEKLLSLENLPKVNLDLGLSLKKSLSITGLKDNGISGAFNGMSDLLMDNWSEFRRKFNELELPKFPSMIPLFEKLNIDISDGISAFEEGVIDKYLKVKAIVEPFLANAMNGLANILATRLGNIFNEHLKFDPKKMIGQVLESVGAMIIGIAVPLVAALALGNAATLGGMSIQWGQALGMLGAGIAMKGGGMAMSADSASSTTGSSTTTNARSYSPYGGNGYGSMQTVEVRFANGALKGYIDNRDKKYNG